VSDGSAMLEVVLTAVKFGGLAEVKEMIVIMLGAGKRGRRSEYDGIMTHHKQSKRIHVEQETYSSRKNT
jgi:hypothetical protein